MTEYISSDTNVWIDFDAIGFIELPFRLPCTYVMWADAVEDEVRSPVGLKGRLLESGLLAVKITTEEFYLADDYGDRYPALSTYDAVALAIAKCRGITLMTGDMRLRRAAAQEGASVIGTIGVLDRLLSDGLVDVEEYRTAIGRLYEVNGGIVRLPEAELKTRLGLAE